MSQCHAALLTDRAVVRASGDDARAFLQGLITNDINKAVGDVAIHAGLLSPQGKILFDFFILAAGDGYLLDVQMAEAAALAQRLGFYRLRAKVEIAPDPSLAVAAAWGDASPNLPPNARAYQDPRLPALGLRIILPAETDIAALGCMTASEDDYHARRIAEGVPEGGRDYAFGETYPHEALFDQLDGVDFNKGCYVGQEVVSRMQHRGTARSRIVGVAGEGPLPASGTNITADDAPIGTLGSTAGLSGLALVRLDRAEKAREAGTPLRAGEIEVSLRIPPWAHFQTLAAAAS